LKRNKEGGFFGKEPREGGFFKEKKG